MARAYTVLMQAQSISAAKDLIRLSAPSDAGLKISRVWIGQEDTDNLNEAGAVIIQRASTDGTGTSATPAPKDGNDAAFGGTAVTNLSADTTAGDILVREPFNLASPYIWTPYTPSETIRVPPSGRIVLRLASAPSAAMSITAGIEFIED